MASKLKAPRFHQNADKTNSVTVQIFVDPFPRQSKTFCAEDYPSRKDALVAAIQWREDTRQTLIEQRQQGNVRVDLANFTLADLNAAYLKDPATVVLAYRRELKRNLEWWDGQCGRCKVLDFGVLQGREAREALLPGRAAGTVNRHIAAQRRAWNWGREAGLVPSNRLWAPGLPLSEPGGRVRYLSDEELPALLTAAKAHSVVMYTAITVAIATGLRKSEQLRLTWADIDFAKQALTVLITKNGRPRSVYLPAAAATALKALKAASVVGVRVFLDEHGQALSSNTLDKMWRRVRATARLKDLRWHDLRHSTASFLAQAGASLPEIAGVLGHLSLAATRRYAHMISGKPVTGHAALNDKLSGSSS
jgi:integrase